MLSFTVSLLIFYPPRKEGEQGMGICSSLLLLPLPGNVCVQHRVARGHLLHLAVSQCLDTCTQCDAFAVKRQFWCFIELRPRSEVTAGFGLFSHAGWSPRKWMETFGKWKAHCALLDKKWCIVRYDQKCQQCLTSQQRKIIRGETHMKMPVYMKGMLIRM